MQFVLSFLMTILIVFATIYYFNKKIDEEILKYSRSIQVIILWTVYFFKVIFGFDTFFISFFLLFILGTLAAEVLSRRKILEEKDYNYLGIIDTNYEILLSIINLVFSLLLTFIIKGDLWNSYVGDSYVTCPQTYAVLIITGMLVLLILLVLFSHFSKKLLFIINEDEYGDYSNYLLMTHIFLIIFYLLTLFPAFLLIDNYLIR